jgi:signal transduction histidine kinase
MRSDALPRHGLSFLPNIFRRSNQDAPPTPLGWRYRILLVGVLLPPLALAVYLGFVAFPGRTWHEHVAHALVEGFCALNSLVLFYVLQQEYLLSGNRRLKVMALSFLAMGILDFFHLAAPHGSDLFVWYRSTAGLFGSLFLFASLWVHSRPDPANGVPERQAWLEAATAALALIVFGLLCMQFQSWLPAMQTEAGFSPIAIALNIAASALFFTTGASLLAEFRRSGEWILFVFALGMLLFTESQAMFPFSALWDASWWAWHGIRTLIFIGILLGLTYEYAQGFRELQTSHKSLVEFERLASLGEMAAFMAHEIRNPLGIVTNSFSLLRDPRLSSEEHSEILDILDQAVNRLNHIVSDTLNFAHPRARQHQPVVLEALVRQTLAPFHTLQKNVEITLQFDPELPPVMGDPDQLQQVVWNLTDNAVAAMERRGRLLIRGYREPEAVVLGIEDSGPGIPEEIRDRVLRPFFSTKPNGMGLGLSIVQRIVSAHDGTLEFDSRVGKGTRVTVRLPVHMKQDESPLKLAVSNR